MFLFETSEGPITFGEPGGNDGFAQVLSSLGDRIKSNASRTLEEDVAAQRAYAEDVGRAARAAERQTRLVDVITSRENALAEAADIRIRTVQQQTGVQLENPYLGGYAEEAYRRVNEMGIYGNDRAAARAEQRRRIFDEKIEEVLTSHPDKAAALQFFQPLEEQAASIAKGAAYDGEHAPGGAGALLGSLAGGIWGSRRDPLFMASLFVGPAMSTARTVLGRIGMGALKQGLFNAGLQAAAQPAVQDWRRELGERNGVVPALENVGLAFVFGAIPGAAFEGGKALLSAPARGALERIATGAAEPGDIGTAAAGLGVKLDPATEATVRTAAADLAHAETVMDPPHLPEGLPAQFEGLSQLQLADIAGMAGRMAAAADTRDAVLSKRATKLQANRDAIAPLSDRVAKMQSEVDLLAADLTSVSDRIAAQRPPTDPETIARLAAIDADLASPSIKTTDRQRLLAERQSIEETIATTAPQDEKLLASLAQEQQGLAKALQRRQRDLDRLKSQIDNKTQKATAAEVDLSRRVMESRQKRATDLGYAENELRRSIHRLSREGYGLALPDDVAREHAQLIMAAAPKELPGILQVVVAELRNRAWAKRVEATAGQAIAHAEDPVNAPPPPHISPTAVTPDIAGAERAVAGADAPAAAAEALRADPALIEGALHSGDPHLAAAGRLATLSDGALGMVRDGQAAPEHAAIVAALSPDPIYDGPVLARVTDLKPATAEEARLIAAEGIEAEARRMRQAEALANQVEASAPQRLPDQTGAEGNRPAEPPKVAAPMPDGTRRDVLDLVPMLRDDGSVMLATREAVAAIGDEQAGLAALVRACNL